MQTGIRIFKSLGVSIAIVALGALFLSQAPSASAQVSLPFEEHFDYAAGDLTTTTTGSMWINISGTGSFIQVLDTPSDSGTSLLYPAMVGISGRRIETTHGSGSREDVSLAFSPPADGSSVFASCLMKVNSIVGTIGDYHFHFVQANSASTFSCRVFVREGSVANTYNLGFNYASTSPPAVFDTVDRPDGATILIVMAYDRVVGTAPNDTIRLWVNPALGQASPPTPLLSMTVGDVAFELTPPGGLNIRQGGVGTADFELDEIRIGTAWTQVTPSSLSVKDWTLYR